MNPTPMQLTWRDFDNAVETLAEMVRTLMTEPATGIYGIPRGGMMLAVPLSHRLDLPVLSDPVRGCIVVDDVVETGVTMDTMPPKVFKIVWVNKFGSWPMPHVLRVPRERWVIFPWEPTESAKADAEAYYASRK